MRTILLLTSMLLCSFYTAHSQGLIVTYEEIAKAALPDLSHIDNPQVRAAVESSMKDRVKDMSKTAQLLVNNEVSIYKIRATQADSKKVASGNISGSMTTQSISATHTIYKNRHDKLRLSQASGLDKKEYLIEEPLTEYEWKIGKKKKMLSDYQCIEASTKTGSGTKITAWYTPDIPVNDGPSAYWGLPGLILYVDINNGSRIFSCTGIEQTDNLPEIEVPSEGEKVSRAQYTKIVTEEMQNLQNKSSEERGENSVRRSGATIIRN
jgi:Protein of unknown function (Porph_ging).